MLEIPSKLNIFVSSKDTVIDTVFFDLLSCIVIEFFECIEKKEENFKFHVPYIGEFTVFYSSEEVFNCLCHPSTHLLNEINHCIHNKPHTRIPNLYKEEKEYFEKLYASSRQGERTIKDVFMGLLDQVNQQCFLFPEDTIDIDVPYICNVSIKYEKDKTAFGYLDVKLTMDVKLSKTLIEELEAIRYGNMPKSFAVYLEDISKMNKKELQI